jgi:hypothetical protein
MKTILLISALMSFHSVWADENASSPAPQPSASAPVIFNHPRGAAQACKTAKNCKGILPRICLACTNGMKGNCAHWSCEQNICKMKTCDIPVKKDPTSKN